MYNAAALLDLHARTHRSLEGLLAHCAPLSAEELGRELPGFGYPDLLRQLEHAIGAEEYWMQVVRGLYRGGDPEEPGCTTIEALEAYRRRVAEATDAYLRGATEAELNTSREMLVWPGKPRTLVPARIFLRTQTHIYQHQGQALAMCRLLGRPGPTGLDFPLD